MKTEIAKQLAKKRKAEQRNNARNRHKELATSIPRKPKQNAICDICDSDASECFCKAADVLIDKVGALLQGEKLGATIEALEHLFADTIVQTCGAKYGNLKKTTVGDYIYDAVRTHLMNIEDAAWEQRNMPEEELKQAICKPSNLFLNCNMGELQLPGSNKFCSAYRE